MDREARSLETLDKMNKIGALDYMSRLEVEIAYHELLAINKKIHKENKILRKNSDLDYRTKLEKSYEDRYSAKIEKMQKRLSNQHKTIYALKNTIKELNMMVDDLSLMV